uniref:Pre-mRNA splicing Prp18-interacting factor n=1 Tax=Tanacetum cinerariifolium TaxID=118510 RepID=A0A6L2NC92_TANCI|nr:hypothetical protein [Tanacetum cinerariifolium]
MSPFVLCVGCGTTLYGFSPCRWCTYERCGNDLLNGFCSLCNSRNSCVYDPKPNSFDFPPDSYHPSHPTYETYSGDSCENDCHLGYDCPPQFPLNYEPEPAYIQNYTSYPHDSPSFPQQYLCCDNCGGTHETFQCQPMNQDFCNSNSFGFDQSQPPQSPVIYPPPQETSIKTLYDQENKINYVQTFLRKFNRYSFFETPKVLLLAWDRVFEIKNAFVNKQYKPEDLQELFRKLFNDVQNIHEELAEYIDTPGWNCPAFDDDDDDVDYTIAITPVLSTKEPDNSLSMGDEHLDTTPEMKPDEIIKSGIEELVPILNENEVTLEDKECDVPVCENSPICDDHFEIFSDSNNDDDISIDDDSFEDIEYVEASLSDPETVSVVEENVVYQEEEEVNFEDFSQIQDVILCEKLLSMNRLIANIESLNDNPTPDLVHNSSMRSGNTTTHANDSLPECDSFCFEIEPDQDKLINVVKNDIPDDSTNDPLLEEADLFLASNNSIPPGIENFGDDSEGDIRFLKALLSDDSIPFPNNESSESDFNNPSVPQPPQEQPDADFEPDSGDEILVVMKNNNNLECLNPRDEFDDDYFSFMFVIYSKMFLSFLSAESEDTIFDPGIAIYRFYLFKPGLSHRCGTFKKFNTHQSHLDESPMEMFLSTCFPSDQ